MSFDLFLFRLDPHAEFHQARVVLDNLLDKRGSDPSFDARAAVDTLLALEPRYRRIDFNYAALARVRRTTEDCLRRELDFVAVDGPADSRMAQFTFAQSYISLSWYAGTSAIELQRYLTQLCRVTGYSVVDAQNGQIYRLQADGELG